MLDSGGQLKVAGFGLIKLSKMSPDKAKLLQSDTQIDRSSKLSCISHSIFQCCLDVPDIMIDIPILLPLGPNLYFWHGIIVQHCIQFVNLKEVPKSLFLCMSADQ